MSETLGSPVPPADGNGRPRSFTVTFDPSALPRATTTVGVALASTAITTSMVFSREHGGLDKTVFSVGVTASVLLLAVAAWAYLVAPNSERDADLVSWPGAAGSVGAGVMLGVLLDDASGTAYAAAGLTLTLGLIGYVAARAWPFVVVVLGALAVLYIKAVDDLTDGGGLGDFYPDDGDNSHFIVISLAIAAFVIAVTVGGWFLPQTRVLTGVLVGIGGLVTFAGVMQVLMIARYFASDFGYDEDSSDFGSDDFGMSEEEMDGSGMSQDEIDEMNADMEADRDEYLGSIAKFARHNPYKDDIYVVLGMCALLAIFWVGCSLATGHVGFQLLVVADSIAMVPMVMLALAARHVTWWGAGLAFVGIAVLILAAYRSRPAAPALPPDPVTPPSAQ